MMSLRGRQAEAILKKINSIKDCFVPCTLRCMVLAMTKGALSLLLALIFFVGLTYAEEQKSNTAGWKLKFGAEERFRNEFKQDFDFDQSKRDNGTLFFHRLRLSTKASWLNESGVNVMDIFVEGLDAQTGSYQTKATATQVDDFDLHQGFVSLNDILGSPFDVKIGRQELKYGKDRLIAQPSWSNRVRAFDTAVVHYEAKGLYADLLYGQDVKYDDNNFNRSLDEEYIAGVYAGYQKDKSASLFESYFLTQVITTTDTPTKRYTAGLRWQGTLFEKFACDIELPYQFGEVGTKDIRAFAAHVDVSRGFDSIKWKPKVTLEYNYATGDKDPNDSVSNTFNPLYQSTHSPYGVIDFFRWQNMREAAAFVQLSPQEKLKLNPQIHFFWLDSKFDSWVNSSGTTLRSKTSGDREYFVGTEAALTVSYDLSKNIKLETGYAHFFIGPYVRDTGADDDADWFYSQVNFKYY